MPILAGSRVLRSGRAAALALGLAACQGNAAPASAPAAGRVVDTGYGVVPAERATGAAAAATGDEMERPVGRVEEMIQGRFSGVQVRRRADGSYSIRIRGTHSVLGSSEPLIVIDGLPIAFGSHDALAQINPRDVARIEVLKDAVSTAMYGVRGANGVILIRTKLRR